MTQDQQPDTAPNQPNSDELSGLRDLIEHQPRLATALGAVVIIVATLLAYIPAMRAGFVWDDDYYVGNNALLTTWTGLQRIWIDVIYGPAEYPLPQYYPMTHTTFWVEYHLWGLNPLGYHVVNLFLHIGCALLVWLILKKLDVPGAWLAAVIFALHPINVESVAWIAERKNVLSLIFYLGALYVYLRYAGITRGKPPLASAAGDSPRLAIDFGLPDDPQRLYALAAVLFLLALFSKTVTNSLPAVVLLIIWWKRRRITLKDITPLLPLFAVGIAMGLLTAYMENVRVGVGMRPWLWDYSPTAPGEFGARCIIAGRAIWFYVLKLVYPYPLIFNYPRWQIDAGSAIQYLFPVSVILVLGILVLNRKRWGDGPLVASLFFVITLFPALGFFNVWPMQYSFVADHFVYFSSIGLVALVAAIAAKYLPLEGIAGIAGAIMLLFLGMTWSQSMTYQDYYKHGTLWVDTLNKTDKKSWFALNNYGYWIMYYSPIDAPYDPLDEAEKRYRKALELYREDHANDWTGHKEYPEAWLNLADIAEHRGGIARMRQASTSQAATSQPSTSPTTNLANNYFEQAVADYREALKADPNFVKAHYLLGRRLIAMGRTDEGVAELNRAIELYPRHLDAYQELAALAYRQGKVNDAIQWYSKMIMIDPLSAPLHATLGTILLENGQLVNGLVEWDLAQKLDPDNAEMINVFGAKMAASGQYAKAADYFQQAVRIDPKSVEARMNLGVAAAKAGFPDVARKNFEEVLQMDPTFAKARENLDALNSGRLLPATPGDAARRNLAGELKRMRGIFVFNG